MIPCSGQIASKNGIYLQRLSRLKRPMTDVARNVIFATDLLTTEYHELCFEAIIAHTTSDKPCSCDDASAMVYLR